MQLNVATHQVQSHATSFCEQSEHTFPCLRVITLAAQLVQVVGQQDLVREQHQHSNWFEMTRVTLTLPRLERMPHVPPIEFLVSFVLTRLQDHLNFLIDTLQPMHLACDMLACCALSVAVITMPSAHSPEERRGCARSRQRRAWAEHKTEVLHWVHGLPVAPYLGTCPCS